MRIKYKLKEEYEHTGTNMYNADNDKVCAHDITE